MTIKSFLFLIIFYSLIIISSFSFLDTLSFLSSPIIKSIINNKNISLPLFDKDNNNNYLNDDNDDYDDSDEYKESISWRGKLFTIIRNEFESYNISKSGANQSCINVFNKYLFGHNDPNNSSNISYLRSAYHIVKVADDSSKTRNFLGSYDQCMYRLYQFKIDEYLYKNITKSTYVVFTYDRTRLFNKNNHNNLTYMDFEFLYYLFGLCLPQGYIKLKDGKGGEYCNDDDYQLLVRYINEKIGNYLSLKGTNISAFSLRINPHDSEKDSTFLIVFCLLPFFFFAIQGIIVVFRNPIISFFKYIYFKEIRKIEKEEEENKNENSMDESLDNDDERISDARNKENLILERIESNKKIKIFIKILDCFCFTENEHELFNFSLTSTKYNNDSGISNVRGIIGISIFFMLYGWTFVTLYNSPVKIFSQEYFKKFINEQVISSLIIMAGVRFSPRVIISCSGYILTYKYLSYLDRNVANNSLGIFKTFLIFIIYQSHKYILLILLLLFERYSLYHLLNIFVRNRPIWKFFHLNILGKPEILKFLWSLTMLKFLGPNFEEEFKNGQNLLNYYWLPYNEIVFFIIGVLLITIGFKKKYRIDIFILFLIPFWFIIKIIYSYLISIIFKNRDLPFKGYIPAYYFVFFNYGRFMTSPLFNFPYFLIGMYFGLMNYTIQKGIFDINSSNIYSKFSSENGKILIDLSNKEENVEESEDNIDSHQANHPDIDNKNTKEQENENKDYCPEVINMPFLISPIIFVQWHRNKNIKYLSILLVIFTAFFIFVILTYFIFSDDLQKSTPNSFINLIFRIDIEFIILFIQWGAFIIFLKADNFAAIFLSHLAWTILTKPYFSFILIINTALLFIFYQSETMIEINMMNLLLYSVIAGVLTFIFTSLFYIFFELPYKRLIHLIISLINEKKENDDIDNELKDCDDSNNEFSETDLEKERTKEKNE